MAARVGFAAVLARVTSIRGELNINHQFLISEKEESHVVSISWNKPILISHSYPATYDETDRLEDLPGLYFFSRRHGEGGYEPFYVGQTIHVRTRLNPYIKSSGPHEQRIRNVIEDWKLINNHHAGDAAFRRFGMNGSRYGRLLPKVLMAHK